MGPGRGPSPADAGRFFACAVECRTELSRCLCHEQTTQVDALRTAPSTELLGFEPRKSGRRESRTWSVKPEDGLFFLTDD